MRIRGERGASAVEYGLLVALVGAVLVVSLQVLGFSLDVLLDCAAVHIETGDDCTTP
jgi:Flp pilus assembly pilin Flp